MLKKEILLKEIQTKSDEEIKEILSNEYHISWEPGNKACKSWYAQVFTYCFADELQEELNFFLWLINYFAPRYHVCFQPEETVFLGCICPCGQKQTVLYYTLTCAK